MVAREAPDKLSAAARKNGAASASGRCRVCGSAQTEKFLARYGTPVHQNLVLPGRSAALEIARGDLIMMVCAECGFVFNAAFDPSRLAYGENYDNSQAYSPLFNDYLNELAHYLMNERGVRRCKIVEVGCGKGLFIRKLVEDASAGNSGYGFDPSYVGARSELDGRLRFETRFFDRTCRGLAADVVVCRHVIEHVPNPVELLSSVREALDGSANPRVFFETPTVEWIFHNRVVWDFFYEHCSLFSASSLTTAFELAGFAVQEVREVFGGQYLWLEATVATAPGRDAVTKADGACEAARQYGNADDLLIAQWRDKVDALRAEGKLALWGAGAKGVTFANIVDAEGNLLDCVVDLNPQKQGRYIPGTGHPIVGYRELAERGVSSAILMNPNYREENERLLREAGMNVRLVE